tara:strand:- start:9 stop:719 length:711 start_codon:yes stop_codon:yes gene_type:complete
MKNIGAIIFSRMTSTRLPEKAQRNVGSKTLLEIVIERTKKIKGIDHICVATSTDLSDDKIVSISEKNGIPVYRGSLNNVIQRAIESSLKFSYSDFLRICGDRPFLDPKMYDELLVNHNNNNNDLTTNILPRRVPGGLSGEVIRVKTLQQIKLKISNKSEKEHITKYFYENQKEFLIQNVDQSHKVIPIDYKLTIDDLDDYQKTIWIYDNLNQKDHYDTQKIMNLNIEWTNSKNKLN